MCKRKDKALLQANRGRKTTSLQFERDNRRSGDGVAKNGACGEGHGASGGVEMIADDREVLMMTPSSQHVACRL